MSGQQLGGGNNMFGDMANSVGTGFETIDKSLFTQQPQASSRGAESFTPTNAQAMYMGTASSKATMVANAMAESNFSISGSSQSTQVFKNYQQIDVPAGGMYGSSLKATQGKKPRSSVVMMAADGGADGGAESFFDFKCGLLDGSGEKSMGELCKDKKAILVVNVASE